jgi:hypothetical protein
MGDNGGIIPGGGAAPPFRPIFFIIVATCL